jgi:hypothetical protein
MTIIGLDIKCAVHAVSRFINSSRSVYCAAMLRIIRYVRNTMHFGMFFT